MGLGFAQRSRICHSLWILRKVKWFIVALYSHCLEQLGRERGNGFLPVLVK